MATRVDYDELFARGRGGGCPSLHAAPMEGLGDSRFRIALSARGHGAFDEGCREFIRIPGGCGFTDVGALGTQTNLLSRSFAGTLPNGANPEKLLRNLCGKYDADELFGIPLAAQIMGSETTLLREASRILAHELRAPRIDLNCGCPANVVTGKGAGSSLLRDPELVYACLKAMVDGAAGADAVVTMKLRSGYDDASLLKDNLLAAKEAGVKFVSLHARTRKQGYSGRANYDHIKFAKDVLDIPVLGNGDVTNAARCAQLLNASNCDGVMIGRGAVQDPLIFRRIKASLSRDANGVVTLNADAFEREFEVELVINFLREFAEEVFKTENKPNGKRGSGVIAQELETFKVGKIKSIVKYIFAANESLEPHMSSIMQIDPTRTSAEDVLASVERLVEREWQTPRDVLVDTFSKRNQYA